MVDAFILASGKDIAYEITARRAGDIACCYADPSYAKELIGWEAGKELQAMCDDTWKWQSNNPNGYK
jgi:UDP-glucose 4-epimerase